MLALLRRLAYNINNTWILVVFFNTILKPVDTQIGLPFYGPFLAPPAPWFHLPAAMPLLVPTNPFSESSSSSEDNSTTRTLKTKREKSAMVLPGLPVKFDRRPPCPPCVCSPLCTPSFFSYCSPCHLKCRCRNINSNELDEAIPVPVPMPPMTALQPYALLPIPPAIAAHPKMPQGRQIHSSEESSNSR